jgi:hypothetical protein
LVGAAHDGAEVMGVRHPVEQDDEVILCRGAREMLLEALRPSGVVALDP